MNKYGVPITSEQQEELFPVIGKRKGIHHDGTTVKYLFSGIGAGNKYPNELSDDGNTLYYCHSAGIADKYAMNYMFVNGLVFDVLIVVDKKKSYNWGKGEITADDNEKRANGVMHSRYVISRVPEGDITHAFEELCESMGVTDSDDIAAMNEVTSLIKDSVECSTSHPTIQKMGERIEIHLERGEGTTISSNWAHFIAQLEKQSQLPLASSRNARSKRKRFDAVEVEYKGVCFKSILEACHAHFFDSLELAWEYEQCTIHGINGCGAYTIDFWIPALLTFVEIKPRYPNKPQIRRCWDLCARYRRDVVLLYNNRFRSPFEEEDTTHFSHADGITGILFRYNADAGKVEKIDQVAWMADDSGVFLDRQPTPDDNRHAHPKIQEAFERTTRMQVSQTQFKRQHESEISP